MTLAARVIAEIDALLLDALVTHTPIPGDGGRRPGGAPRRATSDGAGSLIEKVLPAILEAHARRARAAGDVYLQETELVLADLRRRQARVTRTSDRSAPGRRTGRQGKGKVGERSGGIELGRHGNDQAEGDRVRNPP